MTLHKVLLVTMDRWTEWQQYHKGWHEGRIGNSQLQCTYTTTEALQCYLKVDLYQLKIYIANSRKTANIWTSKYNWYVKSGDKIESYEIIN